MTVLERSGGRTEALLFDGSPLLPSSVYAQPDGRLVTGRDALNSARLAPECFEPHPKLRVDDGVVLLGVEVPVVELFAAVLGRVAAEARRVAGRPVDRVVLTHPAGWGPRRQGLLREGAARSGWDGVILVPEAVAAARYFAEHPARRPGEGAGADVRVDPAPVVVYDLGAGTFDVSVVRGTTVLAEDGLGDVGGLDIDTALVDHLERTYRPRGPDAWDRLRAQGTARDRRAWQQLADDARAAKEMLSRTAQAFVHVPVVEVDAPVGREELDTIATPLIERTVAATGTAIAAALPAPPPGGVFLVGGASRMPLVAGLLHRRLGVLPTVADQPELVVAYGGLLDADADPQPLTTGFVDAVSVHAAEDGPPTLADLPAPRTAGPSRRWGFLVVAGLAVLLVLAALTAGVKLTPLLSGHPSATPPAQEVHGTLRMCTSMETGGTDCLYAAVVAADLESREVTGSKDGDSDIVIGGVNGGVAGLDAVNGAELAVRGRDDLPQDAASCRTTPGWTLTIDPYDLADGDVLCVKTNRGRYGYLSVTNHDSKSGMVVDLAFTYTLWKPGTAGN
ncbi:hypothetical protein GCM10022220_01050 [Actinocatenispora rupis]